MRQEPVSRSFQRSFHYAGARDSSQAYAVMRASTPADAACSPLISVAYHGSGVNPLGMTLEARISKTAVSQSEREDLLEAMLLDAPELTFTPRGNPDPRLVQLAQLLGRQMARQNFEAQRTKRGSNGS